jgi:hypothetical protein
MVDLSSSFFVFTFTGGRVSLVRLGFLWMSWHEMVISTWTMTHDGSCWCWYINANMNGGILMVNITIYSINGSYGWYSSLNRNVTFPVKINVHVMWIQYDDSPKTTIGLTDSLRLWFWLVFVGLTMVFTWCSGRCRACKADFGRCNVLPIGGDLWGRIQCPFLVEASWLMLKHRQ